MSYSGDAAEQVMRMSVETGEMAVRLAGSGAKQVAVMLYAILRDQEKTRGKARLTQMLRSGKELKVFAVQDKDLKRFCSEAKRYGILYCVLKDKNAKDGITDILVRAEDASKVNRIFERFDLSTADVGSVKTEQARERESTAKGESAMSEEAKEDFLDALFQSAPNQKEEQGPNPTQGQTAKSRPSGPISAPSAATVQGISDVHDRASVRQQLQEIRAAQRQSMIALGPGRDEKER